MLLGFAIMHLYYQQSWGKNYSACASWQEWRFRERFLLDKYAEYIGDGKNWEYSQISANNIIRNLRRIDSDEQYKLNIISAINDKYNTTKAEDILFNALLDA